MIMRIFARLKNFYLNLKIGRKLLLMYLVAFIIPFVLLIIYGYGMLRGLLVDRIRYDLDNDVHKTVQSIEGKLDSCISAAYTVVFDKKIQLMMQEEYNDDSYLKTYNEIQQRFSSILTINSSIVSFFVYTNNVSLPSDEVFIKRIDDDVRSQLWYEELKSDEQKKFVYIPSAKQVKSGSIISDKFVITVYMQMPYYIGRYNDIIYCMDIDEKSFSPFLQQSTSGKEMMLLDENGYIISSKDKGLLGKSLDTVLSIDRSIEADAGWFDTFRKDKPNEKLIARYQILKNKWKVIALVSYSSFLSEAQQRSFHFILVYFAFLPLLILFLFLTTRIWTKRIKTLMKLMKQLEKGDFLIKGSYDNGDEFNEMLRSFIKMSSKIGELIKEVYVKEVSKKETELNNLQFLINPHFLYNTLSSIRAMANKNNDTQTSHMISQLARFYRIALSKGNASITIREELDLLKCYLDIQKERFVNLINVHYEVDETLLGYKTLKLVLQPFVENSISHGIWNQNSCINIVIRVYREKNDIVLKVIDDGAGFDMKMQKDPDTDQSLTGGFGIINVDNRIKLSYGADYGVSIYSLSGAGTSVEIRIPEVN